ncbi:MAG: hypothetical protein L0216_01510 [Planctomycetales bacterium]|nr:hypothetical protein [Planctomycetales bacterium]
MPKEHHPVRLEADLARRIERLAERLPAVENKAQVTREALRRGVEDLEREAAKLRRRTDR